VITQHSQSIIRRVLSFRFRTVIVAAIGIWLSTGGGIASAQSSRPYQMTVHPYTGATAANVDIPMFSKGVFAAQPQPPGRSIAWLKVDANLDQWSDIDWSRIAAVYVDEPYTAIINGNRNQACDSPAIAVRGQALEGMVAALRAKAPSARFWVNFNGADLDWSLQKGCQLNVWYIDVISIDLYYVDFTPALSDRYQYIYTHRPTDYQQLALVIPTFTQGTTSSGMSPQTAAQGVARVTQYLNYAATMNQTCHLPLGPTGSTQIYDGCPVWIVSGFLSGSIPPADDTALLPIDHPSSLDVLNAWQSKFAVPRTDPTQVRRARTIIPMLFDE
jgi:hypothetical protein